MISPNGRAVDTQRRRGADFSLQRRDKSDSSQQATITGSGFGASQGNGQVWLGNAYGTVQSWGDGQVVALVAAGSASGAAQVLQNGVWSNALTFALDTLQIGSLSPTSGGIGTSISITGTGFGSSGGIVSIGGASGSIQSWSDSGIVATVPSGAVSGAVRVQQNGVWSNAKTFSVTGLGGTTMSLLPNVLNMVVGDTRSLQALSSPGQTLTGLAWTSSDPTVVSLSADDPPVLTAVAAGRVTIAAGTASADVTVWAGTLPTGRRKALI